MSSWELDCHVCGAALVQGSEPVRCHPEALVWRCGDARRPVRPHQPAGGVCKLCQRKPLGVHCPGRPFLLREEYVEPPRGVASKAPGEPQDALGAAKDVLEAVAMGLDTVRKANALLRRQKAEERDPSLRKKAKATQAKAAWRDKHRREPHAPVDD